MAFWVRLSAVFGTAVVPKRAEPSIGWGQESAVSIGKHKLSAESFSPWCGFPAHGLNSVGRISVSCLK